MSKEYYTWTYPDVPEDVAQLLAQNDKPLAVVGIIGRSNCEQANKMAAFGIEPGAEHAPANCQIQCYYKPASCTLLLHFETTYDEVVLGQQLDNLRDDTAENSIVDLTLDFDEFYNKMRCHFVRMFLLALHVCHIVVYMETGKVFDITLINICKLVKYAREEFQYLPNMLDFDSPESMRLCTPRILFLFENLDLLDEHKTRENISAHEFQTEDNIYDLLRQVNIITDNSATSLLALPNNKQFVFYNAHVNLRKDSLLEAIDELNEAMHKADLKEEDEDREILELAPFDGFATQFEWDPKEKGKSEEDLYKEQHTAWKFLQRHINDVLSGCFEEGSFEQPGKCQLLNFKEWNVLMVALHTALVKNFANPDFETTNKEYKHFLENLEDCLHYEKRIWAYLCEQGVKKGVAAYKNAAPAIYGTETHKQLLADAKDVCEEEGRGPTAEAAFAKLSDICLKYWQDGRQQCEQLSLRGNPCTLPKDVSHEKHNSGVQHISSCNCGRTQGRREDPYTLRQANFDYYENIATMCNLCVKVKQYQFQIFEPSISDYRAAAFEAAFPLLRTGASKRVDQVQTANEEEENVEGTELETMPFSQPATGAAAAQETLSNGCSQPSNPTFGSNLSQPAMKTSDELDTQPGTHSGSFLSKTTSSGTSESSSSNGSDTDTENELVLQVMETNEQLSKNSSKADMSGSPSQISMLRQASTTEYLPGLVHTLSAGGLLPLFPSWSLACVGPSSVYSHNTGLQEHFQSGFLSGANFLLPWDVHVRLQRNSAAAAMLHKQQLGSKKQRFRKHEDRPLLKIFIGFEYECSRGHRFMMCGPDKVLRGGADIERDTSSQVVHNNMPLYYPCPCRGQDSNLAQLMRVHVVTPKAPVNVILDPKVRVGKNYIFTLGAALPPRLSQSAYWILRLPYVYQGDDVTLPAPKELNPDDIQAAGCLMAGMFGVAEMEADELEELAINN